MRLREEGQVYFGEVFIIPKENLNNLFDKIEEAEKLAQALSWRIFDLVVSPVQSIADEHREELKDREGSEKHF